MQYVVEQFKGHPVLCLIDDSGRRVTSFGLSKAKAILESVPQIELFVKTQEGRP